AVFEKDSFIRPRSVLLRGTSDSDVILPLASILGSRSKVPIQRFHERETHMSAVNFDSMPCRFCMKGPLFCPIIIAPVAISVFLPLILGLYSFNSETGCSESSQS